MKKVLIRIASTAVLLALLVAALFAFSKLTERKQGVNKYSDFLNSAKDYDVLFLGSSHVLDGILPLELWNDQGIASYNLGYHAMTLAESYWLLENALLKATPKLVVIDGYLISSDDKYSSSEYMHDTFDSFPLSLQKIEGIFDLLSLSPWKISDWKKALPFLWDFTLYHERWNNLSDSDISLNRNLEKGAERKIGINTEPAMDQSEEKVNTSALEKGAVGKDYLNKIISECKKRGIEVLLIHLPAVTLASTELEAQMDEQTANENGIPFLNLHEENLVNTETDLYDRWAHLNAAGARKVTRALGEYIVQHYDIPDRRGDEAYYDWYGAYDAYTAKENQELKDTNMLLTYLMLLSAKNYDVVMEITDPDMWENEMFYKQVEQLGVDMSRVTENTDLIVLSDGGWDMTAYDFFTDQQQLDTFPASTVLGDIQKEWTDDGQIVLKLNGNVLYSIKNWSEISSCPLKIAVMDRTTKELIDAAFFDVETEYDTSLLITNNIYR